MPKRLKNKGLWVAVAAFVGMILQDMGVPFTPEKYQTYVDAILGLLVLAGILNNPSIGKGYSDKTSK